MTELVIRLVFSLAVVLGIVLVLAKLSSKRFRGSSEALIRVVSRQQLSRGSAVSVVAVGSRVLVLGTTEQRVELLTELDPEEIELDDDPVLTSDDLPGPTHSSPGQPSFAPAFEAALRQEAAAGRHAQPRHARPKTKIGPGRTRSVRPADSALAGSVLSLQTWKQAFAAVTRKAQNAS